VDAAEFPDKTVIPDKQHRIEREWNGDTSYIIIKKITNGNKTRLSKEGRYVFNPVLSPDGKMVAYARSIDSITELRVAGTDSSGSQVLYSKKDVDLLQIHEWSG
jgi:Tol biopolymer transport system component